MCVCVINIILLPVTEETDEEEEEEEWEDGAQTLLKDTMRNRTCKPSTNVT